MKKPFFSRVTKILFAGTFVCGAIVLAQAVSYNLSINSKAFSSKAIVVKGETYIPLKALQAAGVRSSTMGNNLTLTLPNSTGAGGAVQAAALEGCIGQWLFNGIWRFKVNAIKTFTENDRTGWDIPVELRNGTKSNNIAPAGTGYNGLTLNFADGNVITPYNPNDITDAGINQGQGVVVTLRFYNDQKLEAEPQKLIFFLQPKSETVLFLRSLNLAYTVPDASFRIRLNCNK